VLHIVMDYAAGGTVYHAVRGSPRTPLSEDRIWKHAIQLLLGLSYIHGKRIVHRDIKSLILFFDAADDVKIGDFGIARVLGDGTDMLRTIIGTPFYLSPELCEDEPYNEKSDVWAAGVCLVRICRAQVRAHARSGQKCSMHGLVAPPEHNCLWHPPQVYLSGQGSDVCTVRRQLGTLTGSGTVVQYEMCMGKHPFTAQNEGALIRKIFRGVYLPPSGYSRPLLALVQACLTFDARKRPSGPPLLARPDVVAKVAALGIPLDQQALQQWCREPEAVKGAAGSAATEAAAGGPDEPMMQAHRVPQPVLADA
jgi:serine/threonine protein kinase